MQEMFLLELWLLLYSPTTAAIVIAAINTNVLSTFSLLQQIFMVCLNDDVQSILCTHAALFVSWIGQCMETAIYTGNCM